MLSPAAVAFPIGAVGAAEISMPVLSAATSAVAFSIQEGDVRGIKSIFDFLEVPPEHYGKAVQQMGLAWSMSRWFAKPRDAALDVRPTEAMIDRVIEELDEMGDRDRSAVFPESRAAEYLIQSDELLESDDRAELIDFLDHAIGVSLEAGDIEASLAMVERAWRLMNLGTIFFSTQQHMRMAEYWARLGNAARSLGHTLIVSVGLGDRSVDLTRDDVLIASAMTYARIGSFDKAVAIAKGVREQERKFSAVVDISREMMRFRLIERAQSYLRAEGIRTAKAASEASVRREQLKRIARELEKHAHHASPEAVLDRSQRSVLGTQ